MANIQIKKVEPSQADTLLAYSKKTFYEFFAHLNEPANMEAYSSVAFTLQNMQRQLDNPNSEFYYALIDGTIAGYMKLNFNDAQTEYQDKNALEVERIYVSGEHHGKQIGKQMLDFAINMARGKQFTYVWLGVWEHNDRALGFYKHQGFEICGSHDFMLGDDKQTDLLMKKEL
ncbi:MAG: GNAT family N-acetyltransferase [Mucilaginibacter sp.]